MINKNIPELFLARLEKIYDRIRSVSPLKVYKHDMILQKYIVYYKTKKDALNNRECGDMIYYSATKSMYYIKKARRSKDCFWDI